MEEQGGVLQREGAQSFPDPAAPRHPEFGGEWDRTLDDKGRLIVPTEHRAALAGGARLRVWGEDAIGIFPVAFFQEMADELRTSLHQGLGNANALRVFWSRSELATPDNQGRIYVPAPMREAVGIDREIHLVGTGRQIELWSASAWQPLADDGEEALNGFVQTGLGTRP